MLLMRTIEEKVAVLQCSPCSVIRQNSSKLVVLF